MSVLRNTSKMPEIMALKLPRLSKYHLCAMSMSDCTAKPFDKIPGPVSLPFIGTILPYKLGLKKIETYHNDVHKLYQNYGPIVREKFGSKILIHVFEPQDVQKVYEQDGKSPAVPPLQETTLYYRKKKQMSLGLGNINGDDWYRLRHAVQQMMLRPREVSHYLPLQDNVAIAATDRLSNDLQSNGTINNLEDLVGKWIMESAGICCFEMSLGSLTGGAREELAQKMIKANREIFQLSAELKFSMSSYKYFASVKYNRLNELEDFFYSVSMGNISEALTRVQKLIETNQLQEGKFNFLSYLLSRKDLTQKDVMIITHSLFSDGLTTTVPTLLGTVHCLALNENVQNLVYEEIRQNVKPSSPITVQDLNKMSYLKAFIKEVFRMYTMINAIIYENKK